jgi:hypothetical protein
MHTYEKCVNVSKSSSKKVSYFEARSPSHKNCYNNSRPIDSSMGTKSHVNIEEDQKLDRTLAERLAKVVEVLSNLED